MTSINRILKSKLLVSEVTTAKNSGKTIPTIKTIIDKPIAKIIKPIVCGSFSNRKFIIEKKEAKRRSTVVISKKFICYFFKAILATNEKPVTYK